MPEPISPEEHAHYYTPEGCARVRLPKTLDGQRKLAAYLAEATHNPLLGSGFCNLCPEYRRTPVSPACVKCPGFVCYLPEPLAFIANAWIAQHDNV